MSEQSQEAKPAVYLGQDGGYHDDTPENREAYPAAGDALAAAGGEGAGDGADGGDTVLETGTDAPVAKTRKQS